MGKTRLKVGAALVATITVVVVALSLPLEGWAKILAYAVAGFAGAASISLAALFSAAMFAKTDDEMWDSGYFNYMRGVWGREWGGEGEFFQINVCKANLLGVATFLIWLFAIALFATVVVFNTIAVARGIQAMSEDAHFHGNFASLIFITILCGFFSFLTFFAVMPRGIKEDGSRGEKVFILTAITIIGIGLISTLIVAPIRSVGLVPYLIGCAWFFGVIAAIAVLVGVAIGTWKLDLRLSKNIRQKTVPGQLAEMQGAGWKQKVCPMIVGKPKRP